MIDLGALGPLAGNFSSAEDINDSGQIIGDYYLPGSVIAHPFLYTEGIAYDLAQLIATPHDWISLSVSDINNHGVMAGTATYPGTGDTRRAVLLVPMDIQTVSEPCAVFLIPAGVLILRLSRRHTMVQRTGARGWVERSLDRVELTGLRRSALPHHRTCGFPHPAVEPGGLSPRVPRG